MADEQEETENVFLLPCSICSRTFRPESLARHESVCEKSHAKKRKAFDMFKCRVQGTELAEFLGPPPLPGQPPKTPAKSTVTQKTEKKRNWRQTHEALISSLRAARGSTGPTSTTPAALVSDDNEQCPTCGRNFGPRAYDRHVEFCKEQMIRKARTPVKDDAALSRQQARIQYRAPLSIKRSRPEITVTKLPPSSSSTSRPQSLPVAGPMSAVSRTVRRHVATAPAHRSVTTASHRLPPATPPTKEPRSPSADRCLDKTDSLSRFNNTRGSLRLKGVSPAKNILTRTANASEKDKYKLQEMKNLTNDNSRSKNANRTFDIGTKNSGKSSAMTEISDSANKQLLGLLSWPSDIDLAAKPKLPAYNPELFAHHDKVIYPRLTPSPKTGHVLQSPKSASPLHASPTSAFSPVPSSNNNKLFSYDENDNSIHNTDRINWSELSSEEFNQLTSTPKTKPRTPATIRRSTIGQPLPPAQAVDNRRHSSASLTSQSSASTLIDEGILWPHHSNPPKSKKKNYSRSKSVFDDRNRMLFLQTYVPDLSSSEEDVADVMCDSRRPRSQPRDAASAAAGFPPHLAAAGDVDVAAAATDSAYSSLNRRSPVAQDKSRIHRKMSTFCHECGCKYPVDSAKFCCLCGIQRLSIAA